MAEGQGGGEVRGEAEERCMNLVERFRFQNLSRGWRFSVLFNFHAYVRNIFIYLFIYLLLSCIGFGCVFEISYVYYNSNTPNQTYG